MDKKYLYAPVMVTIDDKFKTQDQIVTQMAKWEIKQQFRDSKKFIPYLSLTGFFKNCSVVRPKGVPKNEEGLYVKCEEVSLIRKFIDYHK